jgi:hypothetical protein
MSHRFSFILMVEENREGMKPELAIALARGISVGAWARARGVPRSTVYRWALEPEVRKMVEGQSGLLNVAPRWMRPIFEPSKGRVTWPNGVRGALRLGGVSGSPPLMRLCVESKSVGESSGERTDVECEAK